MDLITEGTPVPCCVDVGPDFEQKVKYALRMLLVPLNLEPRWVTPSEAHGAIYYGFGRVENAAVRLAADITAPKFLDLLEPYDAQQAVWFSGSEGSLPAMFAAPDGEPDLVASTFLWLSGWQEYASPARDEHGRFPYSASLSAALDVAHRPVVDGYRIVLDRHLRRAGFHVRQRRWSGRDWALCPTHDVDYLRKWRPGILYREFVQNLILNRLKKPVRDRLRRTMKTLGQLRGGDPYRSALRRMPEEVRRRGGTATYFLKAGGRDPHDVPYSLDDAFLQEWGRQLLQSGFEIGLHPSYRTPADRSLLEKEAERLREAFGLNFVAVRHHYLRFDPIRTPRIHDELGLAIDTTIGFVEHEGFRRGTCLPFQLYDLEADRSLSTWEMPLAVMDSALFNRRHFDRQAALDVTRSLSVACRRYGGVLVALWHNMLGDELEAPEWDAHFRQTLNYATENGAEIASLSQALKGWS